MGRAGRRRRRCATAPWRSTAIASPPSARARPLTELGEVVEHRGVLMPGTINAHTHLELSHVRVPGGDGLVPWVRRLLATRTPTNVEHRARGGRSGMAARGTVGAVDVSNDGGTAPLFADAGIEARVLLERIAPRGEPPPAARRASRPRTRPTAAVRRRCARSAARSGGRLVSIHVEEDPAEAAWLVDGAGPFADFLAERDALPSVVVPGVRPVAWLDSLGVLGPGTLLVHLTVSDSESLDRAARNGCIAVLCPRSNLHISGRLPPVGGVRAAGLRVGARHRLARVEPDARRPRRGPGARPRRRRSRVVRARGDAGRGVGDGRGAPRRAQRWASGPV